MSARSNAFNQACGPIAGLLVAFDSRRDDYYRRPPRRFMGEAADDLMSGSLLTFDGTGLDAGTLIVTLPMSQCPKQDNDGRNGDG